MANGLVELINYLIPSGSTPRGYLQSAVFSATAISLDFRNISGGSFDGLPFRPSGVFIDNSQGTGALTITVNEISYTMSCPAGQWLNLQFPAPINTTVSIKGLGQATVLFVDFPVIPFQQTGSSLSIAWGAITGTLSSQTDLQNALNLKLTDPTTTAGDIIYRNGAGIQRLPIGTSGQVLEVVAGEPVWTTPASSGMTDPTTTEGDLIYRHSGAPARLGIGTAGQVLTVVSGDPAWQTSTALTNPMTTTGDIIYESGGVPTRLGIGPTGNVLTAGISGVPIWSAASGSQTGLPDSLASGDIYPAYAGPGGFAGNNLNSSTRVHFHLFQLDGTLTLNHINIGVTSLSVGNTIDVGIYHFLGAGKPGTCIISATLSTTLAGLVSASVGPVSLNPGLYFIAVHGTSVSPAILTTNAVTNECLGQYAALSTSDAMANAAGNNTTLHAVLLNDSALPGGSYTVGMDMTGLNLSSSNIVGYNTYLPAIGLTKQ